MHWRRTVSGLLNRRLAMKTEMKTRTCPAAAAALVLGLACALPAAAQNTGGAGTTVAPNTPGALSAPIGGDRDRDWGWLGLLGLLGLAGLRGRRDDRHDAADKRTSSR
jgi:hypothetical protein